MDDLLYIGVIHYGGTEAESVYAVGSDRHGGKHCSFANGSVVLNKTLNIPAKLDTVNHSYAGNIDIQFWNDHIEGLCYTKFLDNMTIKSTFFHAHNLEINRRPHDDTSITAMPPPL